MKKLLFAIACLASVATFAQKSPAWLDPNVNQQNREPRRAHFFAFENIDKAKGDKSASARFLSMEGMWKFNFVKNHQDAPKDFFTLKYNDAEWVDFPVPGLFELNGYGDKTYKNIGYAWCTTFESNPPYIGETNNYTGSYRRTFDLPADWKGQEVFFHVGSATSNLSVWVNGKFVGYSEDSKVAAEFNITKYLKAGKNLIAMQIMRWCDGSYLEDQDFWRFTGIAREVYLYATPKTHIQDITIGQDFVDGKGLLSVDAKIVGGLAKYDKSDKSDRIIDIIGSRINKMRTGYIFTSSDFADIVKSPSVLSRSLGALVKSGKIRKIGKGRFDKPKQTMLGVMPPSIDWMVQEYLMDGKRIIGYMSGQTAFQILGLSTQISSVYTIGSNTYRRAVKRGGYTIRFVLQPNTITRANIPLLQVLDAIRFIRQIPACTPMAYTDYVRAVVGAMLDEVGDTDTAALNRSLNVASTYKIGLSDDALPNRKKWRVQ